MDVEWLGVRCTCLCARPLVVPSQRLRSCRLALGCNSFMLSWVASVWWVMMRGILVVGSHGDGCDGCFSFAKVVVMSSEVSRRSRCDEDVVCAVDAFVCACAQHSIGDGRWILCVRRFGTTSLCVGGCCYAKPHRIADVSHQCKKSHIGGFRNH